MTGLPPSPRPSSMENIPKPDHAGTAPAGAPTPEPATPAPQPPLENPAEMLLAQLRAGHDAEKRRFRRAAALAIVVHAVFFLLTFPEIRRETKFVGKPGKAFVIQQTRFKKPPAKAAPTKQQIPKKKARKIPIPDPTPDDPEPIELEEIEIPDVEPTDVTEVVFGIPDAPPSTGGQFGTGRYDGDAMQLGNGVSKPISIHKVQPPYTEEARQKRIQGVVILQGIVDEKGVVRNLKVVKGLPFGLDTTALEAVYQWKFKPSTFEGKPVAVHHHFTINFSLQ